MTAKETRAEARAGIKGKWGKAAVITLIFSLVAYLLNVIPSLFNNATLSSILNIVIVVISIPLGYGIIISYIKLRRSEDFGVFDFFKDGFNNFASSWKVTLRMILKLIIPIILTIASFVIMVIGSGLTTVSTAHSVITNSASALTSTGLILLAVGFVVLLVSSIYFTVKYYLYKLSFLVLYDNPNMTAKEVVEKSASLMKGNRWKLFCLELSFIGWGILAALTFGIGTFWLIPYIVVSTIVFYETLNGKKPEEAVVEEATSEEPVAEKPAIDEPVTDEPEK